ncbi:hypothetical protein KJ654_02910 [Patescibacteria group bacterium]|nr:hypothetical protein [Patescibacteria group bacterium]MBU1967417.1 hypothetical protein [Patescibacteria group bacterium]
MSTITPRLSFALKKGINYLVKSQSPDGGWPSQSSPHFATFSPNSRLYLTNFIPAAILHALSGLQLANKEFQTKLNKINHQTANFLLSQKSTDWTWNYWAKKSSPDFPKLVRRQSLPHKHSLPDEQSLPHEHSLPDDLDDTACALVALWRFQPSLITNQALAKVTQVLIALETSAGGPYHTWLVEPNAAVHWRDVDLAVNNNVAYFLSLQQIDLPSLIRLTEQAITDENFVSKYYPSPWPIIYFISRWYRGKKQSQFTNSIEQLICDHQPTPLDIALLMNAFLNLKPADASRLQINQLQIKIKQLLDQQHADGSWPASAFCFDPAIKGRRYFAGAKSLTTAVVIETLNKYQQLVSNPTNASYPTSTSNHTHPLHHVLTPCHTHAPSQINLTTKIRDQVLVLIKQRLASLPSALHDLGKRHLETVIKADQQHNLILLPYYFIESLGKSTGAHQKMIVTLGAANVWGWLAYSIYDDVFDNQTSTSALPLANLALRELSTIYILWSKKQPQMHTVFAQIMDTIDTANFTELTQFRAKIKKQILNLPSPLPSFKPLTMLAEKSIGHALGPLAILDYFGHTSYSPAWQSWLSFMYHLLAAQQLGDDIHDWEQDLSAGHLSPVVLKLIKKIINNQDQRSNYWSEIPLSIELTPALWQELRLVFWHKALPDLIKTYKNQLCLASSSLTQNPALIKPEFWQIQLQKLEQTTQDIINDRQQALEFLQHYQEKNS